MKMIKTTLTKTIMAKTTLMETSMNTLLNTISAQITYTRGALIALFAGLFILAACGGGAAPTVADDGGTGTTNVCDTNIFDRACGDTGQVKRTEAINACITAIKDGESCEVPNAVLDCLNAPFTTEGCGADVLRATVTIETVQATRTTDCRAGTVSGSTCTGAIVNVCGAVSSTKDGVLFTETLCGADYNARRSTLVNACVDAVEGGETREDSTACASVVINTDSAANEKALDCVLDAFAEGCDTNTDVMTVVEKTDDTIKSIDDVKTDRVTFCRGASDFATNSLCPNAIKATCATDPFTQTTGASPTNLCTGANDGRATLVTRCSGSDKAGCDAVNVSTGVTVADCVATPYAAGCSNDAFDGLKNARYTHCTGVSPTDDCSLVETTILCLADTAKTSTRANPFSPLCRASSADYTTAQSDFCTARAGDSLPECAVGFVTTCDANPLVQTCIDSGLYTEAGQALTTLCTTDATLFDDSCNGFTDTVTSTDIATTRDNICNTEATSFHAGCLDRTEAGPALDARKAFIQTCLATPSTDCDVPTSGSNLTRTVTQCITNPHIDECKDDLDFAEVKSSRTTLCTDTALYFNPLCNTYENIDTIRETRCTEGATSFDMICDGKGYDADRADGRLRFAEMCRGNSSLSECINTIIHVDAITTATTSVADCVNSDMGDPWHPRCPALAFVEAERIERDKECAVVAVLETNRCNFAKNFNPCVKNPFGTDSLGADCDATVYETAQTNRDTHCRGAGITDGDPLCIGRQTYICDGTEAMGNPFADICGIANHDEQKAFCTLTAKTDGTCSDAAAAATPTACQGNPFNGSFGAYELDCRDAAYYTNRIPACRGEITDLGNFGAVITDCAVAGVSDVICGTGSGDGSNPFAKICAQSEATSNIGGFNQLMEQQRFCGTTRVTTGDNVGDCAMIYTGLCTGADLLNPAAGVGGFNCLIDDDETITGLRNGYCTDPATSFTLNCAEGTHGEVNKARESLALTCRGNPTDPGCDTVADATTGVTVAQCSGYTGIGEDGDPYQAGCLGKDVFDKEREARALACSMGDEASDGPLCGNAIADDACIFDPFGNDKNGVECAEETYMTARGNRESFCGGPLAGTNNPLCTNASKGICDGNKITDTPFALTCGTTNNQAQDDWCGILGNDNAPQCATNHAGACSVRPFGEAVLDLKGNAVNCLTHSFGGTVTYATHRQALCAKGAQDVGLEDNAPRHNCDTTEIAPVVCANSRGVNANPFADFCDTAQLDGQDEAALLATRQTVLSFCENTVTDNSATLVCVNAKDDIIALNKECGVGANSILEQCTYTEYVDTQKMYCAGADSVTVFDTNCEEGTHGGVLAARQKECRKTGSATFNDAEVCTQIVSDICSVNDISALTNRSTGGYLCTDESGVYADARERACGSSGTGVAPDTLTSVCKDTVERLCVADKLIETAVGVGNLNCRTNADTDVVIARQGYCADNASEMGCAPTLTALCKGNGGENLVGTGVETGVPSNNYDCFNSAVEDVRNARQAYCVAPTGDNTGCPDVLTALCTGVNSLSAVAPTGVIGTTFNCADATYLPQRREYCARTGNDDASGCPAVLTTLCETGTSVQIEVETGGVSDNKYNCSTSTVPAVITARETHCRIDGNQGGLCTNTISGLCGDNPFERVDGGASASLCQDTDGSMTYETAREGLCATRPTTGRDVSNCETFLAKICMDNEFGTAGPTDGYNCAGDGEFDSAREMRCGISGTGEGALTEECKPTLVDICIDDAMLIETSVGDGLYNCRTSTDTAVMNARQGYCADNAGVMDCAPTLTTLCKGNNGENLIGTGVATGVPSNNYDCFNSAVEDVRFARQAYCADPTGDDTGCDSVLTTLCALGNSVQNEVATGVAGENYSCSTSEVADVVTAREAFCREDNNSNGLCTDTISNLCIDNEFEQRADDSYVCGDLDVKGTNYARKREATCETKLEDSDCTLTIERVCGTATVPAINATNVKNTLCSGSDYTVARGVACSEISDKTQRETLCGTEKGDGDLAAYCNTGAGTMNQPVCPLTFADGERTACINTNPFAATCNEDFHDNRVSACRDGDKMADKPNCAATVVLVCAGGVNGADTIIANPFDELCNEDNEGTTYDDARLMLCEGDPANLPTGVAVSACKDDKLSGAICGTGTGDGSDSTHGSNPFADICNQSTALIDNFDLTVAQGKFCTEFSYNNNCVNNAAVKWKDNAKSGVNGETDLTVLSAGDADGITNTAIDENTPVTNYILGQTNGLNLGFDQADVPGTITDFQKGDLKLEVLDSTYADDGDGVAFAAFANDADTNTQQKFYAGLLSNTDLGGLLTANTAISTVWKAKAAIIVGTGAVVEDDFTLEVIFGANTITTRAGDAINFGTDITFAIAGKFNTDGVIFGTTTYTDGGDSSTGTVTGLIGEYGAVGAFISDSTNDAGDFAGGFVADNPNAGLIDCTKKGIPFNRTACDGASTVRAQVCRDRATALPENQPLGFNATTDCVDDVVVAICANNGAAYENIFDTLCNGNPDYTMVREAACRPDGTLPLVGADCTETVKTFCEFENSASANIFDSLCLANYASARETACSIFEGPLLGNCEGTIASICTAKPFTQTTGTEVNLCVDASETTTYADARAGECRIIIGGTSTKGATADNCKPVAMRVCADLNPLFTDTLCLQGDTYASNRIDSCSAANPVGNILTLCRDSNLLDTICNGVSTDESWNPYADICAESSATGGIQDFDLTAKRQAFRGLCGGENTNSHCPAVIADFCGSATDAQLFESLCDTGYIDERVAACNAPNADTTVHSTCTTVIATNCPEGNLLSDACPQANTLPASFWETSARNENNSRALNVLDAVGLNDAYTNYVKGTATGLQLGVAGKPDGSIKDSGSGVTVIFENGTVSFADLDHLAGTGGENGAGFAFIDVLDSNNDENSFTDNPEGRVDTRGRYYAGLFSDTELGGPIVGATGTAIWNAAFAGYSSGGSVVNNFTVVDLRINFTDNKIETIDRVVMSNNAGSIGIAGRFTDKGVIYGASSWTAGGNLATGTVTGLIGKKGAVGAFVSSGENDDTFEYAGGFVAAPVTDAICHDGTTDLPFHRLCDANDPDVMAARDIVCDAAMENAFAPRCAPYTMTHQKTALADMCRTAPQTAGCDTVLAGASGLTVNDCTNTDNGHPHQAGCEDAGFTAERVLRIGECVITGNEGLDKCTRSGITAVNDFCKDTPFDADCEVYAAHYSTERMSFIAGCGESAITRGTIGVRDCSHPDILAALCVADGKPVSFLCDGYSQTIATIRQGFCRDDIKGVDVRCVPTRKTFCDANLGTDMILDSLCDDTAGTYSVARGAQCALTADAGAATALNNGCGEEDVSGYLQAFCDTDAGANNAIHCPIKFAAKPDDGVDTAVWEDTTGTNGARNSDNTSRLTILDSVGVGDTFDTNYVKAGTDGLEIDNDVTHTTPITDGTLMLSEAGTTDAAGSGVAFARIDGNFTAGNTIKYYAGILSGTDLGAPVTNTGTDVRWATAISIVIGDRDIQEITTTGLYINFVTNSFKSKNGLDAFNFVTSGVGTDKFFIDGGFTTDGIVYGITRLGSGRKNAHSDGTLTGLIGNKGLVAAFVSDGVGNNYEYAGGFVAVNDAPVDSGGGGGGVCSATGFLFDTTACAEDSHRLLRVSLCENRNTVILPAGINTAEHCDTAEVKAVICTINRNPFDTICDGAYTEVRGEWCVANTGQRLDQCGDAATPTSYIASYCRDTRPLATICDGEAGAEDGLYAVQRHTRCAPEAVESTPLAICVPVIDRLCNAEPFNTAAGEGTTKVNCLTAIDTKYTAARQNRIRLCADGTQSEDSRCKQPSVTAITSVCTDNPFVATCTPYTTQYETQRVKRIAFCEDTVVDNSIHMDCTNSDVAAVLTTCKTTDPFDPVCTPFAAQYTNQRTEWLNGCLTPSSTRDATACANADASICSYYSPFDAICADTNNNEARIRAALACAPDNTRDEDYVLPTLCDTIVSTAAIAAVTVKDCIKDPLNKKCNGTAAIKISDCRADMKREVAACDVRLASGVTIRDCIADPMNDRCSGEVAIGISDCRADPDREVDGCDVVVSAEVPSVVSTKKVSDCVANPWNDTDCPQDIFDNIVKAAVCETSTTSFTAACLDPLNGFVPSVERTRLTPSQNARRNLIQRCADTDDMNNAGCDTVIAGGKTLANCVDNPFDANCRGDVIALALTQSSAAVAKRTALVTRCADSQNSDRTNCNTIVADGKTIEFCTKNLFHASCSGDGLAAAFNSYRAPTCLDPATSFTVGCDEATYAGTHTARAELALGCADDPMGAGCKTIIVSGSLTVDMCNADPFATGCESPAFIHARLEACKGDVPHATCNVGGAIADNSDVRTGYVAGGVAELELGTATSEAGIVKHTSTLTDVGYAQTDDGVYTDQSASGFALVYIPDVRDGDQRVTSPSRYFAGLLSGTDVGGPLQDGFTTASWDAKLAIISQGTLETVDFKLDVDFGAKTIGASDTRTFATSREETYVERDDVLGTVIKTRTVQDREERTVNYAYTTLGQFVIAGKFTADGVIYGTTGLSNDAAESSRGTLTGIIGQNGAVGAFVSSGAGRFVNTLGEYAGGFVAAPGLNCDGSDSENKNPVNPLDIRCDSSNTVIATAQEDTCSDAEGLGNPACIPVFARVCIMGENAVSLEANHESDNARIQCRNAPQLQTKREEICGSGNRVPGDGTVHEECVNTVATVCRDNPFDYFCNKITVHEQTRFNRCSQPGIIAETFNHALEFDSKSETAQACFDLIDIPCRADISKDEPTDGPFGSRFCYIGTEYDSARLEHCADHNIPDGDKNVACKNNTVVEGQTVNIIGDYCDGRSTADDDYGICPNTITSSSIVPNWRDTGEVSQGVPLVKGAGSASRNDTGHIAGGANRLELGERASDIHAQMKLTLTDTNDGIAIATGAFGGTQNRVLQSYAGLLATSNLGVALGRPASASDNTTTFWEAKIALAWQDSGASEAIILSNDDFTLTVTYGSNETAISALNIALVGSGAPAGANFIIAGKIANAGHLITEGTVTLNFSSRGGTNYDAPIHGVLAGQGRGAILATFATAYRSGANAFAGGFVAEDLGRNDCATNGAGTPFSVGNSCSDQDRLAEAARCYNNGGVRPRDGSCLTIERCLINAGGELFVGISNLPSGLACQGPSFDGVRAIVCSNSPELNFCIATAAGTQEKSKFMGTFFNTCIARPFGTNCEAVLGADAYAQSRLTRATYCMTGANAETHVNGICREFIAAVGTSCSNNPFDSACVGTFMTQGIAGFAATAQEWRLSYCTRDNNEASALCTGALTYCAVDVPNSDCGTLVADYCLGGAARAITGNSGACTDELAKTCDVNPFSDFERCKMEQKYIDARLEFCEGDGTTVTGITLASCKTVGETAGQDLAICGHGSVLGSNPFAEVCKSIDSNANHGVLADAQTFYCADMQTDLDASTDCEQIVTSTCGVGEFGFTTNPNKAFDPLCRQATYDYARFAACRNDGTITTGAYYTDCTAFIDTVCPNDGIGLIGCDGNANSTPASVWTDNVGGILAEGAIRQGSSSAHTGAFVQAGLERLDLSNFAGTPAQWKVTLNGDADSGVAFTNLMSHGGGIQLFSGLLRGTNVGGPLVNDTANGNWAGKARLIIGSNNISDEVGFTLNVAFTGDGGTLTTQQQTSHVASQDILTSFVFPHNLRGASLRIDGAFTAEGVIYGTTELYHTIGTSKSYEQQKAGKNTSVGRLTGLIGKTGAVGAFWGIGEKISNIIVYSGGFTATPTSALALALAGSTTDCSATGTPLHETDCPITDYPDATARAAACLALSGITGGSHEDTVCNSTEVAGVICAGTGKYANPFHVSFCHDYNGVAANQLIFANGCEADSSSAEACTKDVYVKACLNNPYDPTVDNTRACNTDAAFATIRTVSRPAFCNISGNEAKPECAGALEYCAINSDPACGLTMPDNLVSRYCLASANQRIGTGTGLCFGSIEAACNRNPFHARCTDSIDKIAQETAFTKYDTARQTQCDGFSKEYLTTADRSVLDACNAYAPAICGYYVAAGDLLGPRERTDNCGFGGDRDPQGEVIEIGSNPLAAICTNKFANRDRRVELTKDEGGICPHAPNTYNQDRLGSTSHGLVLAQYRLVNCPETATGVARLTEGCDVIDIAGGDGYEAWETAVGEDLVTAGDAANATEKTNFIAGYGGGLFLGVGTVGAVRNAATFTIPGTASGFAYATTGTTDIKLFTGLLSGTTDLGGFYASEVEVTWRSTLSFLTNQSGSIAAITKDGFALTLNYDGTNGTIKGIETVGDGSMVFQVDGTFTGNLLSGTVTFGETEGNQLNGQFISGKQSTGTLTGVIGVDGTVGVFKSNTEGSYGDFAGGFVVAPPAPATETVWARSFHGRGGNAALALHSHGLDITGTSIKDGARAYIRLNANNQAGLVNSTGATINTIAFFNNNGLVTPDKGDSGVTFGSFTRVNGGVSLAGLWPTTNMGLPLTAEPATAIWRGKISAIYGGIYRGEKDVRFTIGYDGPGGTGTVKTTERAFLVVERFFHQYINIDAKFDRFGAVFGTTRIEQIEQVRGLDDNPQDDGLAGTVSGLIGEKGLIGAFVSTAVITTGLTYLGGFYALNPDAERAEVSPGAATNAGLWESSLLSRGVNFVAAGRFVVNKFGVDAPDGMARFARFGTGDYIAEEQRIFDADTADPDKTAKPISTQALSFSFDEDSGVGFGKVGEGYYSGLLAGANAGISLGPNQIIISNSPSATWTGKIALYGAGSAGAILPSSAEQDLSLEVTFDGRKGKINTITGNLPTFGQWSAGDRLDYTLTITATFNVAGVISGTTSFYGADPRLDADPDTGYRVSPQATLVSGVLTGLIGTRGEIGTRVAIGSFISTGTIGATSAGAYAGGFVVENPDNTFIPEFKPQVFGADVLLTSWATASGADVKPAVIDRQEPYHNQVSATHFIKGDASGITNLTATTLDFTDAKKESAGGVAFAVLSGGTTAGVRNVHHFAGLLSTADVGRALVSTSPPPTAVWKGKFRGVLNSIVSAEQDFYLHVSFDGTVGKIKSSNANGDAASIPFVNNATVSLSGDFGADGVISGRVTTTGNRFTIAQGGGDLYGLIGERGALGVFKSDAVKHAYAGGFTAANPDFGRVGATDDYNRWRSSFDGAGLNGRVKNPSDTATTVANPLQPRGVNVNQFLDGSTHFVQGEADGLNLTGSNKVTGNSFTPTLLTLDGNDKVGFALWQGDVNVEGADNTNTQGYVGLLIGTDVGESPSSFVGVTYTGNILAYVGSTMVNETFALTIDYSNNLIDGDVTLAGTNFVFDGRFNVRGVMFGDVLTGVQGADGVQGSFNGLIGTKAAVGVFKNTAGNTGVSFIGGFVAEPSVVFDAWVGAVNPLGAGDTNQRGVSHQGYFIRGIANGIEGIDTTVLTLTSDANSGIAFGTRLDSNPHNTNTFYTGLLSGTNVGRHIDNENLDGVWVGKIRAYVNDGDLANEADFNLTVDFGGTHINPSSVGTLTANALNIQFDGYFDRSGVMSGTAYYDDGSNPSNGVFNGLIGTLGAVGVFRDNNATGADAFIGGFVANPPTK